MESGGATSSERASLRARAYETYYTSIFSTLNELDDATYDEWVERARKLVPYLVPNEPVLDCGAGVGYLVYALQRHGFRCKGIDISAEQVRLAQARDVDVVEGDAIAYLRHNRASFGTVVSIDTLEHLTKQEALAFLDAARDALIPGGRVIAKTANANFPFASRIRYKDITHETLYTEETLATLFRLAGLRPVAVFGGDDTPGMRGRIKRLVAIPFRLFWRGFMIAEMGPREGRMGPLDLTLVGVAEREA